MSFIRGSGALLLPLGDTVDLDAIGFDWREARLADAAESADLNACLVSGVDTASTGISVEVKPHGTSGNTSQPNNGAWWAIPMLDQRADTIVADTAWIAQLLGVEVVAADLSSDLYLAIGLIDRSNANAAGVNGFGAKYIFGSATRRHVPWRFITGTYTEGTVSTAGSMASLQVSFTRHGRGISTVASSPLDSSGLATGTQETRATTVVMQANDLHLLVAFGRHSAAASNATAKMRPWYAAYTVDGERAPA